MAITGNVFLIRDGQRKARDDREMHPRTAVGIDYDTGVIFLLVIDGRQSHSRGYTMVETAKLMQYLGADEALNLDGGGSSTMVAQRRNGKVKVMNSPSDGHQRSVPNGLEVLYDPTATPPPAP
jgi:exopolysaccharide biosynthesis protein